MARIIAGETLRTFDLNGRTARTNYLIFLIFAVVCFLATLYLLASYLPADSKAESIYIALLIFCLPVTAAGIRRLHDTGNRSLLMLEPLKPFASTMVLLILIRVAVEFTWIGGIAGIFVALFFGSVAVAIATVAGVIAVFITAAHFSHVMGLLLLPVQPGPNKYGPNPNEVSS